MPNVVNRSEAEAERMLQDAGLKVTKGEAVYDDTIEMGNVVSSTPGSGEQVDEGTSVQLIISKGKDPEKDKVKVHLQSLVQSLLTPKVASVNLLFQSWTEPQNHQLLLTRLEVP